MKCRLVICEAIFALVVGNIALAAEVRPFNATCVEGETHRYDGGNGKDMSGDKIDSPIEGWSTEKWGDVRMSWAGGSFIVVDQLRATVHHAAHGVIAASWSGANETLFGGSAANVYSLVIDTILGEAVFSQTHSSVVGENRQIKVRSQNFSCAIKLLN